ncbi:MAG: 50S ribosomal protein L25/general stress protein Ctc [Gemmatimonadota bacterium]|nr:MAG: 50S ribosomal protein L25/general stress protein Ctc [Gemmatimonadota bacterium]
MTTRVILEAQLRTETGKGAARSLRRQGYVPGVIYGHGEETRACKVNTKELERLLTSGSYESTLIELKLDNGDTPRVLIREVQVHPYRSEVLHVDFLAVHRGEKVRLEVPVRLDGVARGVKEGGILEHLRHEVEIRCDPDQIPEALELDISELGIGDSVTVVDLSTPAGVEILSDSSVAIAAIVPPAALKVEEVVEEVEAVEEEAEPEVIGRGKPAEEEAEEQEQ